VPAIQAENSGHYIRAFNVDPGFVATKRNLLRAADLGHDLSRAAAPEVVGRAIAWVVDSPEADPRQGETLLAQSVTADLSV
jgi:NAD(P)-dependent dehydrogenase (short-subunit alcohol dehydrogenase family)